MSPIAYCLAPIARCESHNMRFFTGSSICNQHENSTFFGTFPISRRIRQVSGRRTPGDLPDLEGDLLRLQRLLLQRVNGIRLFDLPHGVEHGGKNHQEDGAGGDGDRGPRQAEAAVLEALIDHVEEQTAYQH